MKDLESTLKRLEKEKNNSIAKKLFHYIQELDLFHHLLKPTKALKTKINSKEHYCGDGHVHPSYLGMTYGLGEGINGIETLINRAIIMRMKFIAINPHFKIYNLKATQRYVNIINYELSKVVKDYSPIILIPGVEKGYLKHALVHAYGVNEYNANAVEQVLNSLPSGLEEMIVAQDKFNESHSKVKLVVTPAHWRSFRGYGKKRIRKLYRNGYSLLSLEITNTGSKMLQTSLGELLRREYGSRGPTDWGGSDSHKFENVGVGYVSLTVPKERIRTSMDIYDCIINKETTTNYLRIPAFKRILLSKSHYLSPLYLVKFAPWILSL